MPQTPNKTDPKRRIYRCAGCNISPLPEDIPYLWGVGPEAETSDFCEKCRNNMELDIRRGGKTVNIGATAQTGLNGHVFKPLSQEPVKIALVPKLTGLSPAQIHEWLLPRRARDTMRMYESRGQICFVSDGKRIWRWVNFPYNANAAMDWDRFVEFYPNHEWLKYSNEDEGETLFAHIKMTT